MDCEEDDLNSLVQLGPSCTKTLLSNNAAGSRSQITNTPGISNNIRPDLSLDSLTESHHTKGHANSKCVF